jgi:hypothetical protein
MKKAAGLGAGRSFWLVLLGLFGLQQFRERHGSSITLRLKNMPVLVGRDARSRVPNPVGNQEHVRPSVNHQADVRVPKVVGSDVRQPGLFDQHLPIAVEVARMVRPTEARGENQPVFLPDAAKFKFRGPLVAPVVLEHTDGFRIERHAPDALLGFRGGWC